MIVRPTSLRLDPGPSGIILRYMELKTGYRVINLLNEVAQWLEIECNHILCKEVANCESRYPYFEKPTEHFDSGHSSLRKALNQLCNKIN